MPRTGYKDAETRGQNSLIDVNEIARTALDEVARRSRLMKHDPDPTAISELFKAAVGQDPVACSRVSQDLLKRGISAERICEVYIPAVARRMGEDWISDDMSFSAVTIGSARLQSLLREIGPLSSEETQWSHDSAQAVLMLLASDTDHTLGIMVLAAKLRRRGLIVKLSIGEAPNSLIESLRDAPFEAVFISASTSDSLKSIEKIVNNIRQHIKNPPPIVLGGICVEQGLDATAITGVDKITDDVDIALRFCALTSD